MTKEEAWNAFNTSPMYLEENDYTTFCAGWDAAIASLQEPIDKIPYKEIVDYLNEQSGKHFQRINATKDKIKARWNEGFRLDDFKHVIKSKCDQWVRDPKMAMYLRPDTLFGTKFDAYLNETPKIRAALEDWQ